MDSIKEQLEQAATRCISEAKALSKALALARAVFSRMNSERVKVQPEIKKEVFYCPCVD